MKSLFSPHYQPNLFGFGKYVYIYIRQFDDFYCTRGAGQTKLGRILHEGPNVRQSFGGCYKIPYKIFTHFDHVTKTLSVKKILIRAKSSNS